MSNQIDIKEVSAIMAESLSILKTVLSKILSLEYANTQRNQRDSFREDNSFSVHNDVTAENPMFQSSNPRTRPIRPFEKANFRHEYSNHANLPSTRPVHPFNPQNQRFSYADQQRSSNEPS